MACAFPGGLRAFAILNSVAMLIHANGIPVAHTASIKVSHLSVVKFWGFDFHKWFFLPSERPWRMICFLTVVRGSGCFFTPCSWKSKSSTDLSRYILLSSVRLMQSSRLQLLCLDGHWILTPLKCAHLYWDLWPSGLWLSSLYSNCLGYEFSITEKESHFTIFQTWLYIFLIFFHPGLLHVWISKRVFVSLNLPCCWRYVLATLISKKPRAKEGLSANVPKWAVTHRQGEHWLLKQDDEWETGQWGQESEHAQIRQMKDRRWWRRWDGYQAWNEWCGDCRKGTLPPSSCWAGQRSMDGQSGP